MRAGKVRIPHQRLLKQALRDLIVAPGKAEHVVEAEMVGRPGIEAGGRQGPRAARLIQGNVDVEFGHDGGNDPFPEFMHIADLAGILLAPQHAAGARLGQFHRHLEALAGDLDRAGQAIACAENLPDLAHVRIGSAEAESGAPRDHEQPAQARQAGDQFMRQGFGQRRIVAGHADQAEGQDGNGGLAACQLRWWRRRFRCVRFGDARPGLRRGRAMDLRLGGKAEADAVHGADQPLAAAIISQQLAGRLDPARQGRIRYGPPVPDLFDDLVLAHQAVMVLRQQQEERQDLRLGRQQFPAAPQLEPGRVQFEIFETIQHLGRR